MFYSSFYLQIYIWDHTREIGFHYYCNDWIHGDDEAYHLSAVPQGIVCMCVCMCVCVCVRACVRACVRNMSTKIKPMFRK